MARSRQRKFGGDTEVRLAWRTREDEGTSMKIYRTGNHWGVTIIETDSEEEPDAQGRRSGDRLVAVAFDAADATKITEALNESTSRS